MRPNRAANLCDMAAPDRAPFNTRRPERSEGSGEAGATHTTRATASSKNTFSWSVDKESIRTSSIGRNLDEIS